MKQKCVMIVCLWLTGCAGLATSLREPLPEVLPATQIVAIDAVYRRKCVITDQAMTETLVGFLNSHRTGWQIPNGLFEPDTKQFTFVLFHNDGNRTQIECDVVLGVYSPGGSRTIVVRRGGQAYQTFTDADFRAFQTVIDYLWKHAEEAPDQALQTTWVTRSGFGKDSVSDRQRRGV